MPGYEGAVAKLLEQSFPKQLLTRSRRVGTNPMSMSALVIKHHLSRKTARRIRSSRESVQLAEPYAHRGIYPGAARIHV
jgi:hypothetical protein